MQSTRSNFIWVVCVTCCVVLNLTKAPAQDFIATQNKQKKLD